MCKIRFRYKFVNLGGAQFLLNFDAKSKMLLKPLVGVTFLKNAFEQETKLLKFIGNHR